MNSSAMSTLMGKIGEQARSLAALLRLGQSVPLAISSVAGQAIMFLSLPLLLRIYGPEAYGAYSVAISVVSVLLMASTLKLDVVIPTMKRVTRAARLASALLLLALGVALLLPPAGLALNWLTGWNPGHAKPVWLMLVLMAGLLAAESGFVIVRAWLVRIGAFAGVAAMQILRPLTLVGVALAIGFFWPRWAAGGGMALVTAAVVAGLAAVAAGFMAAPRRLRRWLRPLRWRRSLQEVRTSLRFLSAISLAQVLYQVNMQIPLWGVVLVYGVKEAGWVAVATRIAFFPATIVGTSLGLVLNHNLSRAKHAGQDVSRDIDNLLLFLFVSGLIVYAFIAIASEWIFQMFGSAWDGAELTLQAISLVGFGFYITSATIFIPVLLLSNSKYLSILISATFIYAIFTLLCVVYGISYAKYIIVGSSIMCLHLIVLVFSMRSRRGLS